VTASEIAEWAFCPEAWRLVQVGTPSANQPIREAAMAHHANLTTSERVAGGSIAFGSTPQTSHGSHTTWPLRHAGSSEGNATLRTTDLARPARIDGRSASIRRRPGRFVAPTDSLGPRGILLRRLTLSGRLRLI
jgi:hypothetical protein